MAIQDSMGWNDYHLHEFRIKNLFRKKDTSIGIPDDSSAFDDWEIIAGWEENIKNWFTLDHNKALYIYDFGDDWEHIIEVEDILEIENKIYPECIDAKKANAFDDIGGIWGYQNFLEIMKDKNHPEYEDMIGWCDGDSYDEDRVSVDEINSIIQTI